MPKRKGNEAEISTAVTNESKRKVIKRKRKIKIEWSSLFRFSVMLFFVGIIVFHYYLITENALITYYQSFWGQNKEFLTPILIITGYTLTIFLIGYWLGKRR